MPGFVVKPLTPATWLDFAALVERHNGVWGGCWCMAFHSEGVARGRTARQNRADKECRVKAGTAHAALAYDGPTCVGWCQFGSCAELPRIKHRRAYEAAGENPPDWRITCFFVDKGHRRQGVAAAALRGAIREIARLGGGVVEGYPEDVAERPVSSSFLYGGSASMFEAQQFKRVTQLGKNHWVFSRVVKKRGMRPNSFV